MKKRLFLMSLMTLMLVCLLALSVGAVSGSTSNEYGEITYVDGISEVKHYDTTSRVVLQNANGTYTTYPAYYVYNGSSGTDMRLSFNKLNEITGEEYSAASVVRVEVFENSRLNWTFSDCTSLIDVYLPEGTFLHYASFAGCSALTSIKLPETGVTQIPTDCFSGCLNLESIEIPSTVSSLGMRCFQNCLKLSVIKIPEKATGVIPQDFRKITNWSFPATPVTYIVPNGCTGVNSKYSIDNCNVESIIYTGQVDSEFMTSLANHKADWVSKVIFANHCEYYYDGVHTEDSNPCVINCERCNTYGVAEKNPIHNVVTSITYTSYDKAGEKKVYCTNEGCEHSDTEEAKALFVSLGYSRPLNENGSFTVGYQINSKAMNEYSTLTGKTFKYGLFVASQSKLGNNEAIDENGTAAQGVISADMTKIQHTVFELKIRGFVTDEQKAAKLALGAYVIEADGEDSTVSYLQTGVPQSGEKYFFASYNDIIKITK